MTYSKPYYSDQIKKIQLAGSDGWNIYMLRKPYLFKEVAYHPKFSGHLITLANSDVIVSGTDGKFGRYILAKGEFKQYAGHVGMLRNPRITKAEANKGFRADHSILPEVTAAFLLPNGDLATSALTDGVRIWDSQTQELKQHIEIQYAELLGIVEDTLVVAIDNEYIDGGCQLYKLNDKGQYCYVEEVLENKNNTQQRSIIPGEGIVQFNPKVVFDHPLTSIEDPCVVFWEKKTEVTTHLVREDILYFCKPYLSGQKTEYALLHLLPSGQLLLSVMQKREEDKSIPWFQWAPKPHRPYLFVLDLKTLAINYFGKQDQEFWPWEEMQTLMVKDKPVVVALADTGYVHFFSGFHKDEPGFGMMSTYSLDERKFVSIPSEERWSGGSLNKHANDHFNPIVSVGVLPDDRIFVRYHMRIDIFTLNESGITKEREMCLEGSDIYKQSTQFNPNLNYNIIPLSNGDFYAESWAGRIAWDGKTGKRQTITPVGEGYPGPLALQDKEGGVLSTIVICEKRKKNTTVQTMQTTVFKKNKFWLFCPQSTMPKEQWNDKEKNSSICWKK